jgi:hypothetical protein
MLWLAESSLLCRCSVDEKPSPRDDVIVPWLDSTARGLPELTMQNWYQSTIIRFRDCEGVPTSEVGIECVSLSQARPLGKGLNNPNNR